MNIEAALNRAKLDNKVKVVVPCSFDSFESSSNSSTEMQFRSDVNKALTELLTFSPFHCSNNNLSKLLKFQKESQMGIEPKLEQKVHR